MTESPPESPPVLLIVDDTAANLGVIASHLEDSGFEIVIAQSGEDGIKRAQPAVVKVVVAFLLVIQAAFSVVVAPFLGAVVGLRCTSSIGFQLRVEPDQRFGLALRAAA